MRKDLLIESIIIAVIRTSHRFAEIFFENGLNRGKRVLQYYRA